ncbi:extracellular solute-binding protein, partial [Kitasatospora sp. NPDC058263]
MPRPRHRAALVLVHLLTLALAACGSGADGGGGPVTLDWYNFPDDSGALQQAADSCGRNSGGRYSIRYNKLPRTADAKRQQLVRRLAAHDAGVDIMGLDVTWAPEFAEAGWIREWTGALKEQAGADTLAAALKTATWKDRLYAVPYNSNTQLLWYRDDLVPTPPRTWAEMLGMADALAKAGKPHFVEVQGAQYEGLTVWFNTLVTSAGGSVLTPDATAPSLGPPAVTAAGVIRDLA